MAPRGGRRTSLASMRSRLLLALVCVLAGLVAAPSAQAGVTTRKAMWGPAAVDGVSQFPIYAELGVGIWETTLSWAAVAAHQPRHPRDPDDPAYTWPSWLDQDIADAARYGITVLISVSETPSWANGGRAVQYAPTSPAAFGHFMAAASRRYPAVKRWLIWGEPSKSANFLPTHQAGARRYAQMLDEAYVALKGVSRSNLVIGGDSYTIGACLLYTSDAADE